MLIIGETSSRILRLFFILFLIVSSLHSSRAEDPSDNKLSSHQWHFYDPVQDSITGIGLYRAKQVLEGLPSSEVLVAIIDTGFDIDHPDLREKIWINRGEIAENGVDDDRNGYIDDIHGWNFLGGSGGNVIIDNFEVTREYKRLKQKYAGGLNTSGEEYDYWLEIKQEYYREKDKYQIKYDKYSDLLTSFKQYYEIIEPSLEDGLLSIRILEGLELIDEESKSARDTLISLLKVYEKYYAHKDFDGKPMAYSTENYEEWIQSHLKKLSLWTEYFYNVNYDPRYMIGDEYQKVREHYYGNNEVWEYSGPYGYHGTHVAGIIAGQSNMDHGAVGIADNVKLMLLRACSTGDERDKDIANAIRYAADNGARIINMSFGKFYSPYQRAVYKAIRYAEKKGVLMIHSAGNEFTNTDIRPVYPNPDYESKSDVRSWITVGASYNQLNTNLAASFSNFGQSTVDLFAPGVKIYSSMPDKGYKPASGTSMSAPVVSGVAALIMSYFPTFSAREVKNILMESVYKPAHLQVYQPGSTTLVSFAELSRAGGIVNVYNAILQARELSKNSL
jgi:subtilisin family serine protease